MIIPYHFNVIYTPNQYQRAWWSWLLNRVKNRRGNFGKGHWKGTHGRVAVVGYPSQSSDRGSRLSHSLARWLAWGGERSWDDTLTNWFEKKWRKNQFTEALLNYIHISITQAKLICSRLRDTAHSRWANLGPPFVYQLRIKNNKRNVKPLKLIEKKRFYCDISSTFELCSLF